LAAEGYFDLSAPALNEARLLCGKKVVVVII